VVYLRYSDVKIYDAGIGGITYNQYRCASIFDPDLTGIGHQPLGRDQWAEQYNDYAVLASTMSATFSATNTSGATETGLSTVGITTIPTNTTLGANVDSIIEQPSTVWRTCGPSYAQSSVTVSSSYTPKDFFGVGDPRRDSSLAANMGSNPVKEPTYNVFVGTGGLVDPAPVRVRIVIVYKVVLYEPKKLLAS
jgi:hypothetical protein